MLDFCDAKIVSNFQPNEHERRIRRSMFCFVRYEEIICRNNTDLSDHILGKLNITFKGVLNLIYTVDQDHHHHILSNFLDAHCISRSEILQFQTENVEVIRFWKICVKATLQWQRMYISGKISLETRGAFIFKPGRLLFKFP